MDKSLIKRPNDELTAPEQSKASLIGRGLAQLQNRITDPVITMIEKDVAVKSKISGSLLVRDLKHFQWSSELEARYRTARDLYNDITDYGCGPMEFSDTFDWMFNEFLSLAECGFSKTYLPLSSIYFAGDYENDEKYSHFIEKAVEWLLNNSHKNDPDVLFDLGLIYEWGWGVETDKIKSFYWYSKAEDVGSADAKFYIGRQYIFDSWFGNRNNLENGLERIFEAARAGLVRAQFELGWLFRDGKDVEKDYEQSIYWFNEVISQGDVRGLASFYLGQMYEYGQGVKKDILTAVSLYRNAARNGQTAAKDRLSELGYQEN